MNANKLKLLTGVALVLSCVLVHGVEIVRDNYTAVNVNSGFALTNGVNSGINPPTTRLSGTSAANLRYIQTATGTIKATNSYTIGSNKLKVAAAANSGRFTLSANGTTPFDFGPVLGVAAATPTNPSIYEIKINMDNDSAGTQRFSLGLGTEEKDATFWDFGIQLYRVATADTTYAVQKRIDALSSPAAVDINSVMITNAGTFGTELSFIVRVTDAGPETDTNYNSRVQVYQVVSGVTNAIYDTQSDSSIQNVWRLDGGQRYIMWDVAGNAAATYDTFVLNLVSPPIVSGQTWTGGGTDDNWSTGDNWGGVAPSSGQVLTFNGTTRQANINDIADLLVPTVNFNNGGFSISGLPFGITSSITNLAGINTLAGDVYWTNTVAKTWSVANGSELVLNNTNTIDVNGDHSVNGGGTLRHNGTINIGQASAATPAFVLNEGTHLINGGKFYSSGGYRVGSSLSGAGAQTILTNGATFNLTASTGNLRVGDSANTNGARLEINNCNLTMTGGTLGVPYAAGAIGIVNQVGGTVAGGIVAFNDNGAGTGTYNIKNGVLEAVQIREDFAAGTSAINFDNAILRTAPGANTAFFSGLDVANIQTGGLIIDATTDVTIGQLLSGTGPLIKSNFAAVTLTNANTFSGNTLIQGGKLVFPNIQSNATSVQVADGAEFGVRVSSENATLSIGALNFAGASFSTLSFDLGSFGTPTSPLAKVTSLSVSGPVTVNIANGIALSVGQIVLVDYVGTIAGGFQFTLGSLPPGVSATLVNNTANSSVDLNITAVPGYRWTGATSSDWDTSTANWINLQTGSPSTFSDGFPTEFRDGATTGFVNITGIQTPSLIVVNNDSLPYVWSTTGSTAITTPKIKKFGTNSVTRVESGADLVTEIELNQGSFAISNAAATTFTTFLTDQAGGTGTFVKQGANVLTMGSTNTTYDGAIKIESGILKLANSSSLGTTNGATTISSGGTLDVNDIIVPGEPIFVSGQGYLGQGAIIDSTTGGAVAHNLTDVTMLGNTTFGAPNGGRWDIRVRSSSGPGPGLRGNGYNLTKVGSGYVSIACQRSLGTNTPYWEMNLGDIVVQEGTLALAESLSLGNPSKTITINSGAAVQLFDLGFTNPIVRNIFITDGKLNCGGGNTDTNPVNGTITLTGACSFKPDQAVMIINGPIVGTGSLAVSANEPGRVYLNAANTFSGDTIVTNGTIGGTGSLAGNLIMLGGTNSPGAGSIGTFTVSGNVTLAGTTLLEINRAQSPNSDRLVVGGTLNNGGSLKVVLATGAASPQAGDVYQLFNKAGAGTFTNISLPDLSALPGGLSWNTTNLYINGFISVSGTVTSPNITSSSVSGGNFIMSGTGGIQGNSYTVLSSTNVALPIANWTPVVTNVFGPGGSFEFTNGINPADPATFYLLRVP